MQQKAERLRIIHKEAAKAVQRGGKWGHREDGWLYDPGLFHTVHHRDPAGQELYVQAWGDPEDDTPTNGRWPSSQYAEENPEEAADSLIFLLHEHRTLAELAESALYNLGMAPADYAEHWECDCHK